MLPHRHNIITHAWRQPLHFEMDAFGGARAQARAPERGVFPLDHDGDCKEPMQMFLQCLKENKSDHFPCKSFTKTYLKCRMEHNLMAKDDLDSLGLKEGKEYIRKSMVEDEHKKESKGFVAGLNVRGSSKWNWIWSDK
jgi:hypothetical protein